MEKIQIHFLKTDDNKIINENCVKWAKKMEECLEVCLKANGCHGQWNDTHKICKMNNLISYNRLNKHFD